MQDIGRLWFLYSSMVRSTWSNINLSSILNQNFVLAYLFLVYFFIGIVVFVVFFMMMMMMMMIDCFGMVDQRKAFSLISSWYHCQRSSPLWIWHTMSRIWTCAEPELRLSWMKLCSSDNHYTNWSHLV